MVMGGGVVLRVRLGKSRLVNGRGLGSPWAMFGRVWNHRGWGLQGLLRLLGSNPFVFQMEMRMGPLGLSQPPASQDGTLGHGHLLAILTRSRLRPSLCLGPPSIAATARLCICWEAELCTQADLGLNPSFATTSCATLGKLWDISEPGISHV